MRDHTKLRVFELADEVAMLVYRATVGFPKEELFGLTSQIRGAAVSVPCEIIYSLQPKYLSSYKKYLTDERPNTIRSMCKDAVWVRTVILTNIPETRCSFNL